MEKTDPISFITATDAIAALAEGQLTSRQLVEAFLTRITERDDAVRAWTALDAGTARAAADVCDTQRRSGKSRGMLHGIPVGVKDVIDTADFPTGRGTAVFAGRRPDRDAAVVAALRSHGAIVLGKTVTTELAFFGPGATKNPHDPNRTPGGSSSGSAAAVADGQVPLALGTQTAGSVIRPASYCGCIGFKPTFGWLSRDGVLAQSEPLDTIGGYARSVADIALLMDAMRSPPGSDADQIVAPPSLTDALADPLTVPPRFALFKTPAWSQGDADMHAAIMAFANDLSRNASVSEISLPSEFDRVLRFQQIVQFSDIARNYGPIADGAPKAISQKLKDIIDEGKSVTAEEYHQALAQRDPLYTMLERALSSADVIIAPAAAGVALQGLGSTGLPAFQGFWTYLGVPTISLPLMQIGGLPLGLQLVAPRMADGLLLRAAAWLMARTPPLR